jgi:ABC-type phosphate transport system substrate-binding protein
MRKLIHRTLFATALLSCTGAVFADDYVIIVNKANADSVTADFVEKAYRGEAQTWPGGGGVVTVILPESSPLRAAFDKKVLDKTPAQSKGMWAKLTFAGKMPPPKAADDEAAAVKIVSEDKGAIGYVSAGAAGAGVKVVK